MADPVISAVVPVYNRAASIGEALDSILGQEAPPDEVIVVDDGSADDIVPALERFGDRVRLHRQDNAGAAAARNAGVRLARGDWLTFLDSDDRWLPGRMTALRRDLAGDTDVVAHLGDVRYVGRGYRTELFALKHRSFPSDGGERVDRPLGLVLSGMTLQGAAIRRSAWDEIGGLDETMRIFEDTAFFGRLSLLGAFLVSRAGDGRDQTARR